MEVSFKSSSRFVSIIFTTSYGSKRLEKVFYGELKNLGIKDETKIIKTKCTGRCKEAPVVVVENQWLTQVKEKNVEGIIEEAFSKKHAK